MALSSSLRSRKGTFVRTPISRATSFMSFHMREPHGETAPWSMVSDSSGTRAARSTTRWTPVPSHTGQAPVELKAISSAPSPWKDSPHWGHTSGTSRATLREGGTRCPLGHR